MPFKPLFLVLLSILFVIGCATPSVSWHSMPAVAKVENPYYFAVIEPEMDKSGLFIAFQLEVTNNSGEILKLDWNESAYLYQGNLNGRMVFNGIDPEEVKQGRVPLEQIDPGQTIHKKIGPLKLISIRPRRHGVDDTKTSQITFGPFPAGYNGFQLVIRSADKAVVEDLQIRLFYQ